MTEEPESTIPPGWFELSAFPLSLYFRILGEALANEFPRSLSNTADLLAVATDRIDVMEKTDPQVSREIAESMRGIHHIFCEVVANQMAVEMQSRQKFD